MTAPRHGVVVRLPNRLGDFVLSLPAAATLAPDVVVVSEAIAALARDSLVGVHVLGIRAGWSGFLGGVAGLREIKPRRAILLPGSATSAAMMALAGIPERWGESTRGRGPFLTRHLSASTEPQHLASHLLELATGTRPMAPPTPRITPSAHATARFRELYPGSAAPVGIFPGASAPSRRWPRDRFRELVRRLCGAGEAVIVFGGESEVALTRDVAGADALDLGGRTDLPTMAAGLARCRVLIANDTGPMHLAAAVGTPVVAFFGPDRPARVAPLVAPRRLLIREDLPCLGCRRAACPRTGPGTVLPRAEHECLELIAVDDAMRAIGSLLLELRDGN